MVYLIICASYFCEVLDDVCNQGRSIRPLCYSYKRVRLLIATSRTLPRKNPSSGIGSVECVSTFKIISRVCFLASTNSMSVYILSHSPLGYFLIWFSFVLLSREFCMRMCDKICIFD